MCSDEIAGLKRCNLHLCAMGRHFKGLGTPDSKKAAEAAWVPSPEPGMRQMLIGNSCKLGHAMPLDAEAAVSNLLIDVKQSVRTEIAAQKQDVNFV